VNAALFLGAFFFVLWIACLIADGFHRLSEARSVTRSTTGTIPPRGSRARDMGTDADNAFSGDETTAARRPSPNRRSSRGGTLPSAPAPDAHYLIDLWKERRSVAAMCTCGAVQHGLLNRADAEAWVALHDAYATQAEQFWTEKY
jgi:hypothetical protein